MRIGIMGAGAVGSLVGALLSDTYDVVLIGRPNVAKAIKERGVRVSGRTELHVRPEASDEPAALEGCDIVLLTVKAYDTAEAALLVAMAEPRTMLVTLQNGLDNDERVKQTAPGLNSCAAVTSLGVTFLGPGHVRHAGEGESVLGRMACSPAEAERTADILTEGGIPLTFVDNVRGHIWLKGIVNHCTSTPSPSSTGAGTAPFWSTGSTFSIFPVSARRRSGSWRPPGSTFPWRMYWAGSRRWHASRPRTSRACSRMWTGESGRR
jgi:2-dehydropantoate 2-reductase